VLCGDGLLWYDPPAKSGGHVMRRLIGSKVFKTVLFVGAAVILTACGII
jgi:hypothetical protein